MKKLSALFLVIVIIISAASGFYTSAVSQQEPAEGGNVYYFSSYESGDEPNTFNIEKVILPADYKPVYNIYYDYPCTYGNISYPKQLTLVFTDGSTLECEPNKTIVLDDNREIYIKCVPAMYIVNPSGRSDFDIILYDRAAEKAIASTFVKCEPVEHSLKENISHYISHTFFYIVNRTAPPLSEMISDPVRTTMSLYLEYFNIILTHTSMFLRYIFHI